MLTMLHIMAILLAVLIAGVAYSSEKPNLKATEPKNSSNTEQRGSANNPLTVKILPSPDAETKAAQEEKYRNDKSIQDEKLADATLWLARITAALAVFTGLLWFATYRLAKDAKRTADRQAGEMQASLSTAKQSADAADRMAITMKDTAERQLRAYVSVATAEINDITAGFTPRAHLVIRNSGQTPAYDLIGIGGMAMGVSWEALTPGSPHPIEVTKTSLAAGAIVSQDQSAPRPLAPGEREALIDGSKTLWVYGEMRYKDTFNIERITEYRFQIGGTVGVRGNHLSICQEGNRET